MKVEGENIYFLLLGKKRGKMFFPPKIKVWECNPRSIDGCVWEFGFEFGFGF